MRISEQWLREWVDPPIDTDALAVQLTMAGLEVDTTTPANPGLAGVMVARILEIEPHPRAGHLTVCRVDAGGAPARVVCGAPNARAGLLTAYAPPGARLPGHGPVEQAAIRGTESAGMLCSEAELALSEQADTILELGEEASPGAGLSEALGLDDTLFDIDLTPNRGDCLSMAGVAREVGALNALAVRRPAIVEVPATVADTLPVELAAPEGCPIYGGRVIRGIDPAARSPLWLRERLRRAGLRSIGPLVDVTNYVMLELGQPMHAFDLAKLAGGIRVRWAAPGERLTLLDGTELTLAPDVLVIADHERAVAAAGIMGGLDTAVDERTSDVFLESAFFAPDAVAGRARRYKLHTDASHRFERGVAPELQAAGLERASALLAEICGGEPGPVTVAREAAHVPARPAVPLRADRLERLLGWALPREQVTRHLEALEMQVETQTHGWRVVPPPHRFDIAIEADLVEEVARLAGYDALPPALPAGTLAMPATPEARIGRPGLRALMADRGYHEAITYAFVDADWLARFTPEQAPLPLENPIAADRAVMRTSLLPGLLEAWDFNRNRQQARIRLFELGAVFLPGAGALGEVERIAGLAAGPCLPEQWGSDARPADFFDLKGDLEALCAAGVPGRRVEFRPTTHPALHPGQAAAVWVDGRETGVAGAVHPAVIAALGEAPHPVLVFELALGAVGRRPLPAYATVSKYPMVRRDISVVLDAAVPAAEVAEAVRAGAGALLRDLQLFDVYAGEGIDSGKKSLALGLIFQGSSSTLTDEEVDAVVAAVVAHLRERLGAALRG